MRMTVQALVAGVDLVSRSGHPALAAAHPAIKATANDYSKAIRASVKTVKDGICFADNVTHLCDDVLWRSDTNASEFVEEMQRITQRAHNDASDAYERFRSVRRKMLQVCICDYDVVFLIYGQKISRDYGQPFGSCVGL